ncbi:hypothetical protein MNAN1_001557 [Malassezia nana]|uniref:Amidohydrolase 3 domain-containing protein n=1 Tax=Malassezia nana TaxID=180528 RepID=A0AAF0J252_9BASI|nr:hypothetical protein MNAN1_001557 [Malassezia nana]
MSSVQLGAPYRDNELWAERDAPKESEPLYSLPQRRRRIARMRVVLLPLAAASVWWMRSLLLGFQRSAGQPDRNVHQALWKEAHTQCTYARAPAGAPPVFSTRTVNDRLVPGTPATVIRNATVFTGDRILHEMDVLLDHGLIQFVSPTADRRRADAVEIHAAGAWLTPGLIDMHTHLGVLGMPLMPSTTDGNSRLNPTQPMLRSVDALNEHDQSLRRTLAGGITSVLVLPGSLNNIGGQAYPVKLGSLAGRPPSSRVVDPPRSMSMIGEAGHARDQMYADNTGMQRPDGSTSFRQIKMACGENARKYQLVRMDEAWNFRSMLERAQKLRERQDDFCAKLDAGQLDSATPDELHFPNELALDVLVDVLRGRTKVQTHCYTMNDLDAFVRHANEFDFSVAAFHHAHETYLVPSVLHGTPGGAPAVALFSTNANYKYESYFGSPFQPELLRSHNITPILKSDHPVLDSRRLLNQAAQAHHFGLPTLDALRAVTSAPAHVLGLAHRLGHVLPGMDADVVLWDRHPLQLGATPTAVWVDGRSELEGMHASGASPSGTRPHHAPPSASLHSDMARVRNASDAIADQRAMAFPTLSKPWPDVVLVNLSRAYVREQGQIHQKDGPGLVLVWAQGQVRCLGGEACLERAPPHAPRVDTRGGVLLPGLISYGATLGLSDIPSEASASNGEDPAALTSHLRADPERLVSHAVDGLVWGGYDLLRAHASGVSTVIAVPQSEGLLGGVSAQIDTSARSVLDALSVRASRVALHATLAPSDDGRPSLSMQVALLRTQLQEPTTNEWEQVARGHLPLVVATDYEHMVAQLILLKRAMPHVCLVLDSAAPLHRVAAELAAVDLPVLLPNRVWMYGWERRDRLAGPPLTAATELSVLLEHGVRVGVRIDEAWEASNLLWETTWAAQDAHVQDATTILSWLTTSLEDILQLPPPPASDVVLYDVCDYDTDTQGDPFAYGAKVLGIGTPRGWERLP